MNDWSFNADFSGLDPFLNALTSRWGQAMDYQLQDLSQMPQRNETAFKEWLAKRAWERENQAFQNELATNQINDERRRHSLEQRQVEADRMRAMQEERIARQAGIDRARSMHTTYGGPTQFNPSGAVADYYEYGAGSPQGRGGGGSVNDRARVVDQNDPCYFNPRGPGCPDDPLRKGYGV